MKERYLKVLALFSVSTLIPTVLLNSKAIDNSAIKLLSEIESCLHDTILSHFFYLKNLSYSCFLKKYIIET